MARRSKTSSLRKTRVRSRLRGPRRMEVPLDAELVKLLDADAKARATTPNRLAAMILRAHYGLPVGVSEEE